MCPWKRVKSIVRLGRAKDLDDPGQGSVGAIAHVEGLKASQSAHAGAAGKGQLTLVARAFWWSSMLRSWAGACTVGNGASGNAMKDGADIGANASRRNL